MFNYFEPLFGSTSTSSKKIIILLLFFITLKKKKKEIESLSCKSGVSPYEKCPNKARLIFFDELSCLSFRSKTIMSYSLKKKKTYHVFLTVTNINFVVPCSIIWAFPL